MAKPAVVLVGADKGGVGKTTVSRTLLDYFGAHQTPTRAFDTEAPRGTLHRFHPEKTEIVDVTQIADQMKIFDTLGSADAKVTVIDIRAGLLSPTLQALNDIGFIESAKKGQITFAVFHILGPSIASLEEIAETARFVGDASYFLVKNHINDTSFFDWDPATANSYFNQIKNAQEIVIPKLNEMATEQVEVASVPYVQFVANKNAKGEAANYSFVLRGYVRHWLGNVWGEYDRVKLIDLVSPKAENNVRQVAG
jgi:MinD-like ATPase involved in chromosome partitioning or flagellar assembly